MVLLHDRYAGAYLSVKGVDWRNSPRGHDGRPMSLQHHVTSGLAKANSDTARKAGRRVRVAFHSGGWASLARLVQLAALICILTHVPSKSNRPDRLARAQHDEVPDVQREGSHATPPATPSPPRAPPPGHQLGLDARYRCLTTRFHARKPKLPDSPSSAPWLGPPADRSETPVMFLLRDLMLQDSRCCLVLTSSLPQAQPVRRDESGRQRCDSVSFTFHSPPSLE